MVSDFLYKKYPHFPEGTLTNLRSRLVNTKTLAQVAKELDFGSLLRLSKGEEESKGRQNQSLLADSFEAFIGALFLDQGIQKVSVFLATILLIKADEFVEKKSFKDAKSLLQEYVQAKKQNSPLYKVLSEEGPPHAKVFTVGVYVQNKLIAKGKGNSKQEAEKQSAELALETLFKK
ncbi:MAG: ribonuclease III [Candidatus Levybacteria bacterium]|nr:ribonuclease III [Candidatus Levybacteria bacterium]